MEKITFVKFYQGVNIAQVSNVSSQMAVDEITAQHSKKVKLEKGSIGIVITTEDREGKVVVTEVPYNNVAYINYEAKTSEQKPKAEAMKPSKASSESK